MTPTHSRGFTLIELMIALGIFGAVLAFAIPNFISYTENQKLRGTAQKIYSTLRICREKAIASGRQQILHFTANYLDSDYHMHNGLVGDKWSLPNGISYYYGTGFTSTYTWTSDGKCMNSGNVILQDMKGRRDTVSVQLSGMIICR